MLIFFFTVWVFHYIFQVDCLGILTKPCKTDVFKLILQMRNLKFWEVNHLFKVKQAVVLKWGSCFIIMSIVTVSCSLGNLNVRLVFFPYFFPYVLFSLFKIYLFSPNNCLKTYSKEFSKLYFSVFILFSKIKKEKLNTF